MTKRDYVRWHIQVDRDADQRVRLLLLARRVSLAEYVRRLVDEDLNRGGEENAK